QGIGSWRLPRHRPKSGGSDERRSKERWLPGWAALVVGVVLAVVQVLSEPLCLPVWEGVVDKLDWRRGRGGEVEALVIVIRRGVLQTEGLQVEVPLDEREHRGERGGVRVRITSPGEGAHDDHGDPDPHAWRRGDVVVEASAIIVGDEDGRGAPLGPVH